jgi:hypothetical protein
VTLTPLSSRIHEVKVSLKENREQIVAILPLLGDRLKKLLEVAKEKRDFDKLIMEITERIAETKRGLENLDTQEKQVKLLTFVTDLLGDHFPRNE